MTDNVEMVVSKRDKHNVTVLQPTDFIRTHQPTFQRTFQNGQNPGLKIATCSEITNDYGSKSGSL